MDKKEEYKANGWVARDGKGQLDEEALYFYTSKPTLNKYTNLWLAPEPFWQLPTKWFPEVLAGRDLVPVKFNLTIKKVGK